MNPNTLDAAAIIYDVVRVIAYLLLIAGWALGVSLFIKAYVKRRKRMWLEKQKYTTILVRVPKNNEKGPLSAQMMFAALHGTYKSAKERLEEGSFQDHMSFEIVSTDKYIRFYIFAPTHLKDFIEGQIYAQYPNVLISEVPDYTLEKRPEGTHFIGTELSLARKDYYPIKTFQNFEVDPLAGITGVLSQVSEGEQVWVQILARPAGDRWQRNALRYVSDVRAGKTPFASSPLRGVGKVFGVLIYFLKALSGPEAIKPKPGQDVVKLSGPAEQAVKAIEEKSTKLGYESKIRLMFLSKKRPEEMKIKLQSIIGVFKQFNSSNLNSFVNSGTYFDDLEFLNAVQTRKFEDDGFILNIEELASLYHLPAIGVETPTIDWVVSRKGEPPATLPTEDTVPPEILTTFAKTDFRDKVHKFGIKIDDRRRHMYIIGQTGTGKSTMMKNMMIDDVREGRGVAVIDPHGEFVDSVLDYIPEHRINDVIVVNPGDRTSSVGFNLLENVDEAKREILASGLMSIFKKIWEGVWSARMEHIMKNVILALMEVPGATLMSATKMLVNKEYRKMVLEYVKDPVVREFWLEEFENQVKTNPRFATEAIAPIQNKVGQFLSMPSVRNMIGQPKSTINIKDIMDNKKILLVKVSKGDIGDDNMALLGAMLITKIQLTAMERSNMKEEEMEDFYLYVDEFQNFATSSFITILSEARKYKLNLIVAHQYMAQIPDEVRDAVIGNAGNKIAFRVGENDAAFLKTTFDPVFDEKDLVSVANHHIYIKMIIDGVVTPPFSAVTLPPLNTRPGEGNKEKIIALSRQKYGVDRNIVEKSILDWQTKMAELSVKSSGSGERKFAGSRGEEGSEAIATEKPREKYREVKAKDSSIWYIRKKKVAPASEPGAIPVAPGAGDSDTYGHEGIKDIYIAPNEVAEDVKATSIPEPTKILPDERIVDRKDGVLGQFIFPEEHHLKDEDHEIKPGESIEI